ncbi:carbohydrate kinase family protein [Brachybacterium fresconis]|uniref:Sugar/nucleoside kinase (Ribokinase family) n=1 Tax=Brachybacterium fresconis TaxID=173363 RepID=A0ABS4YLW5_9MICO|nr:PfkB family carbohydrate kinase [Brachybacterium fresconis]MBP2409744.1 sugar/nucleoside kinase (ribokinase family) [Brachybacterium fresconis]
MTENRPTPDSPDLNSPTPDLPTPGAPTAGASTPASPSPDRLAADPDRPTTDSAPSDPAPPTSAVERPWLTAREAAAVDAASDWDPLAGTRGQEDPPLDVLLSGTVFFDIVFTGLDRLPAPGEELWSKGMGSSPGGIANLAVAAARLGLRTGLVAGFGDDAYADWMWHTMAHEEGIDLSASRRFPDFHSPLTASVAAQGDRAMVTHGHDLPEPLSVMIARAPAARAAVVDLAGETGWWADLARRGSRIFADIGFDETGRWDVADLAPLAHCHAFTPNAVEAMGYTRTESPDRAVRALAEKVPLAVVTDGAAGSYAIDATTGEEAYCPAVPVTAIDTTGAGDVFAASMVLGTLADWPLDERLKFASLCSALAVQQFGGSLAAPGWGDITDWWRHLSDAADGGDLRAAYTRDGYCFLDGVVPDHQVQGRRRAQGTFALRSDAGKH